jgi:hypothetical protein
VKFVITAAKPGWNPENPAPMVAEPTNLEETGYFDIDYVALTGEAKCCVL